jgi:hypothetical protein
MGRGGNRGRGQGFVNHVLRARKTAGVGPDSTTARRGVPWQPLSVRARPHRVPPQRLFAADRRVVVKAGVVRHLGRAFRSAPPSAHVAYVERDGVTRDGEKGRMFGAAKDRTDAMAFARRGLNDRHHFRFVVTPEDAAEMTDLGAFTATWYGEWW